MLLPGFVDTHVHYPQIRVIGGLGMPLLDWLEQCALPEEAGWPTVDYADVVAAEFVDGLLRARDDDARWCSARTSRPPSTCCSSEAAAARAAASPPGWCVSDRILREDLLTTPERALRRGPRLAAALARQGPAAVRGHPAVLAVAPSERCWRRARRCSGDVDGALVHLAPQREPAPRSTPCAGCSRSTTTTSTPTTGTGWSGERSVLAHNVHPGDAELDLLAEAGAAVAHCPSSNSALGSGLFPLRRHVERGVRVALGTDVGRRHELLAAPGGPAGVLHAVPARRRTGCRSPRRTCCTWPPGPGAEALGPRRAGRRPVGRQAVRRGVDAPGRRQHPGRRARATPTTPTTPWRRCSRWAARRTSAGCGSAAIGCADAAVYGAASGSRDIARICRASWGTSASPVPR